MFEIQKKFRFEAAHLLVSHDGPCRNLHGHSYQLNITLRATECHPAGPKQNMVMDYHDIVKVVQPMIRDYFDHHFLNETLKTESPTAEFIAQWVFCFLREQLPGLYSVSVSETESSMATYTRTE